MDLLDIGTEALYFEEPGDAEANALISEASRLYGKAGAEFRLLRAYFKAPAQLTVLVALYRFYYYQHRWDDALLIAERAERLGLLVEWRALRPAHLGLATLKSMGCLRFYLLTLKATAYLHLRLGRVELGAAMLLKLTELDPHDRLGVKPLLKVARAHLAHESEKSAEQAS